MSNVSGSPESGTFHVDNFDHFAGQDAHKALATRFDHYGESAASSFSRQRRSFRLEQRFAAGDLDERNASRPVARERTNFFENFFERKSRSAVERIRSVAPSAAEIASGQAHEDTRQTRAGAFSLDGFEDFGDDHQRHLRAGKAGLADSLSVSHTVTLAMPAPLGASRNCFAVSS